MSEPSSERGPRAFGPRRMAEWLSFGVIDARVTPLLDEAKRQGSRFVLPVEVENRSSRSARDLQISVRYEVDGRPQSMQLVLYYVGQTSLQVVYAYFREDPRGLAIRAEPLSYRVD